MRNIVPDFLQNLPNINDMLKLIQHNTGNFKLNATLVLNSQFRFFLIYLLLIY